MNCKSLSLTVAAAVASASVLVFSPVSHAAPISYSTGFEQPVFEINAALPTVPTPAVDGWFRQDGTPTLTALPVVGITNVAASAGTQSLRVLNSAPADQGEAGSVTYAISPVYTIPGSADVVANNTPFVTVQWDMRVDDGADIDDTSDTWTLDVYDSTANTRTVSVARSAIAAISGGAPTSSAIYLSDLTGAYIPAPAAVGPASGVWGTYRLELDYTTDTFAFFLNNTLQGVGAMNAAADNGLDINFTVNGRGLDVAYFDNFSVSAVPEPSSLALVGLAAGGLLVRRRNRR